MLACKDLLEELIYPPVLYTIDMLSFWVVQFHQCAQIQPDLCISVHVSVCLSSPRSLATPSQGLRTKL